MPKVDRWPRIFAATWFFLAAAGPAGAWLIYLFGVTPELWQQSLSYALSAENEHRLLFAAMAVAALFSFLAFVSVLFVRAKTILRAVLVGGCAQLATYLVFGAWFWAFVAAMPLWWLYKVQHEV